MKGRMEGWIGEFWWMGGYLFDGWMDGKLNGWMDGLAGFGGWVLG